MAVSVGSVIAYSDLSAWYDAFNNLARTYSNGIATISKPSSGGTIRAAEINNLHSMISRFRTDKFLGTQSAYWPTGTNVSAGNVIYAASVTAAITRAYSNASRVKCKNTATNNSGRHSSSCRSGRNSSSCSNGRNSVQCTYGRNENGARYNGASRSTPDSNGDCRKGYHNSGTCQSGRDSCGTKTCGRDTSAPKENGTTIDILCTSATKANG